MFGSARNYEWIRSLARELCGRSKDMCMCDFDVPLPTALAVYVT